mmetsp:Transcript_3021/g.6232  ORF Transcript_3021/g.6232 Transcript_3021/m.6232 type:complete len:382 (+) Transcript_3021:132-1277(+)
MKKIVSSLPLLSIWGTSMANALAITTFNILAPVHRSMPNQPDPDLNRRESERQEWWRPRAEGVADYIAEKFASSDVILLQEWWFDESFTRIFDEAIGDAFERVAERRPGSVVGQHRDDGMCCLVRKQGLLELVKSDKVLTGPQRIAQIIQCRERLPNNGEGGRNVFIANSHLSFPGDKDPTINNERQKKEAGIILDALTNARNEWDKTSLSTESCLEIVCGDFNSNSCSPAAALVEDNNFVNCVSATANQLLTSVGGAVNIGTTHCDHLGNRVSVDHIFLRVAKRKDNNDGQRSSVKPERCSALALGYLDTQGTRILAVQRDKILISGSAVLSDHRPVTAKIEWPRLKKTDEKLSDMYINVTMPLDPLEPAWGIVQDDDRL